MAQFNTPWPPPAGPSLSPGTVHIWRAWLEQPPLLVEQLAQTLAADEQQRAAQYRFAHHRRRFIVARGLLRSLLASYTGAPPSSLRFSYSLKGKPALIQPYNGEPRLYFNVAHSEDMAIYAFAPGHELGIDVEQVRPIEDIHQIAKSYFSPPEREAQAALVGDELYSMFFRLWTRKEAYLKACGEGLSLLTEELNVLASPGQVLRIPGRQDEADWFVHDLEVATGYQGALAIQSDRVNVVYYG